MPRMKCLIKKFLVGKRNGKHNVLVMIFSRERFRQLFPFEKPAILVFKLDTK